MGGVTARTARSCKGRRGKQRTALSGLSQTVNPDLNFRFSNLYFENLYYFVSLYGASALNLELG